MLFNSLHFPFFFIVFFALYFSLPHRFRYIFALAASCYFYMYFIPKYLLILVALILVDYAGGLAMERWVKYKSLFLWVSVAANVGTLVFFKYLLFFDLNLSRLAALAHIPYKTTTLSLILPLGLSFHTFQSLSYIFEVYFGRYPAERRLDRYALYVLFWPQLVAGPIERPQNLLRQLQKVPSFSASAAVLGLRWILLGFFKKTVIADNISVYVDKIYGSAHQHQGPVLWMATYLFAIQLYCDFSGYTDIARGCAKIMGIDLMENFNLPYLSKSVAEFWRRWHISLSSWLNDYLFAPLLLVSMRRWSARLPVPLIQCMAFISVFLVIGLWHGARWTFVIMGALHGLYLSFGLLTQRLRARFRKRIGLSSFPRVESFLKIAVTFHLVCFSWIFFRAGNLGDAYYITTHLFTGWHFAEVSLISLLTPQIFFVILLGIVSLFLGSQGRWLWLQMEAKPRWVRWSVYYACLAIVLFMGVFEQRQFIYFQF